MYHRIIQQCAAAVERIGEWMDIAAAHAEERKFDVQILMDWQLAPDMGRFVFQIQSACDYLKGGAARLSGQQPPSYPNVEVTMEDARALIRKAVAFARSVTREQMADAGDRMIKISWIDGEIDAEKYLVEVVVPNVTFHVSMAYAILRQAGVDVGKRDYLGPIYPDRR
ncbi:DUF1993 domain-containing protein [Nostoc sp. 3335mG]|nr:DUF1993 domain-containing protein [Nostoc sp. 3335mG]